jgi:hypothetical protein
MSASIIQFVSTNLANRFEQIGVSVRVLKRSVGGRPLLLAVPTWNISLLLTILQEEVCSYHTGDSSNDQPDCRQTADIHTLLMTRFLLGMYCSLHR